MKILKSENWWVWLLLLIFSNGASPIVLGSLLGCYSKKEWYANYKYWLVGFICLIFPALIMAMVFYIQILCLTAAKLEVSGKEIYLSPYIWLICAIIPFIGWVIMAIMFIYLQIWIIVKLYEGNGEKYIK